MLSNHISNGQINGFMEDRFGQMWISTFRGLNKYDGNTFHQYYCIDDSIGLPDNNVTRADSCGWPPSTDHADTMAMTDSHGSE